MISAPVLDEALVGRVAALASDLDGGSRAPDAEAKLAELNRLAGTALTMRDLQGIYGAMSHDDWARELLSRAQAELAGPPTREEAIEMVRRVMTGAGPGELAFYLRVLQRHVDEKISDAIFWPGKRKRTAEQIVERAWLRRGRGAP